MKRPVIHRTSAPSSKRLRVPLFSRCIDIGKHVQLSFSVFEAGDETFGEFRIKSLLNSDILLLRAADMHELQAMITDACVFFPKTDA